MGSKLSDWGTLVQKKELPAQAGGLGVVSQVRVPLSSRRNSGGCFGRFGVGIVVEPAGAHQTSRQEGQRGRKHQLRVESHELRNHSSRLLGLVKVLEDWIDHETPPFRSPNSGPVVTTELRSCKNSSTIPVTVPRHLEASAGDVSDASTDQAVRFPAPPRAGAHDRGRSNPPASRQLRPQYATEGHPRRVIPSPFPILFTDFDGTFIDSEWSDVEARARLARAASVARVVFASSRTVTDLTKHFARWGWTGDCIAENGAEIAVRDAGLVGALGARELRPTPAGPYWVLGSGEPLEVVVAQLEESAREAGVRLDGTVHETLRSSSLLLYRSKLSTIETGSLRAAVHRRGLNAADGGDWLSVWSGADKGQAALRYLDAMAAIGTETGVVAAIGNAENDIPLLSCAGRRFVIRSPGFGHYPGLAEINGATLLTAEGAAGWDEALELLRIEKS